MFMPGATQAPAIRRFGVFEVDLRSGELRKNGMRLRLSGQPFQVLAVLIERPGEVVTREELRSKLWRSDTFVDFDHGLNNAVARIREVLDDSSDTPRYVETIPRRGYRFIGPVKTDAGSVAQSAVLSQVNPAYNVAQPPNSTPAVLANEKRVALRQRLVLGGAAFLVVLASALVLYRGVRNHGTGQAAIKSLAVLPLKNLSGDPRQEYLADGMTEELIGRLAAIRDLRVISRTSVMRFKETQLSVPEIAKTLQVDALVEGSVIREGSRIRVHAQLIRGATDEHFWSEVYDRELRDMLALQSDVAQAIAQKVEVTVTSEEQTRLAAVRPISPEVYENYLKGKFALSKGNKKANVEESISYFNAAIRKDPTFAPSYVELARAYSYLGTVFIGGVPKEERPKIVIAARKALELDPELVDAHVELANVLQAQWHWAEAEAEYRRALQLRPNDAAAYSAFAWWLVSQGRVEEALVARRHGRELDPLAVPGSDLAWDLFYARRYDEAMEELRSVLAVKPDDAYALWIFGFALIADRRPQEAIPVLEKGVSASDRSPALIGLLIHAYSQAGHHPEALRLLQELKRRKKTGYVPAAAFVKAYLGLGDYDQAFFWLEEAYKEQSNMLLLLKVHPIFDPVCTDPRFTDLMRRVGLR
jgi:TolB-like protein/DNA-binding winged helix-turn-helix (wHTH) protein/tetratricopeptide (TPR) repeat protein